MEKLTYAASVMCARLVRLEDDFRSLEQAGVHELHFDIMDGAFVPNITLGPDFIRAAKEVCRMPCWAHLMISAPEKFLRRFRDAGADGITVHVESSVHVQRLLAAVRDMGASPGIAINPATPLTKLEYLLDYADRVLVMAVDPGFAGQQIIPSALERVRILKHTVLARRLKTRVEVDGNITAENAARLALHGADILVLGTSSIFKGGDPGAAFPRFVREAAAKRDAL